MSFAANTLAKNVNWIKAAITAENHAVLLLTKLPLYRITPNYAETDVLFRFDIKASSTFTTFCASKAEFSIPDW